MTFTGVIGDFSVFFLIFSGDQQETMILAAVSSCPAPKFLKAVEALRVTPLVAWQLQSGSCVIGLIGVNIFNLI